SEDPVRHLQQQIERQVDQSCHRAPPVRGTNQTERLSIRRVGLAVFVQPLDRLFVLVDLPDHHQGSPPSAQSLRCQPTVPIAGTGGSAWQDMRVPPSSSPEQTEPEQITLSSGTVA